MNWPVPHSGLVIRYSYLWADEAKEGREEGIKDRPCAVALVVTDDEGKKVVRVLPITHTPPQFETDALEIPLTTKKRLGLDDKHSWIILTEANDFIWPGPDLRIATSGDPSSIAYGVLPPRFFAYLRNKIYEKLEQKRFTEILRTE